MCDRRRYGSVRYYIPMKRTCLVHDAIEDVGSWVPEGDYYHESAVRELVAGVTSIHTTQDGVSVCAYIPGPCPICELLAHYKDLCDE